MRRLPAPRKAKAVDQPIALTPDEVALVRAMVIYEVHPNVQVSFTGLFGRPLNFGKTTPREDFLKRLQFDLIYTF